MEFFLIATLSVGVSLSNARAVAYFVYLSSQQVMLNKHMLY